MARPATGDGDVEDAERTDDGSSLLMRDLSRAGHELGRTTLVGLPAHLTIGALLERRIRDEVASYNREPGPVYVGFVQPEDAVRYHDGHRMRRPRRLDADRFVLAAQQAVAVGLLSFRLGDRTVDDLDDEVAPAELEEIVAVLQRPVVARDARPNPPGHA